MKSDAGDSGIAATVAATVTGAAVLAMSALHGLVSPSFALSKSQYKLGSEYLVQSIRFYIGL